MPDTPRTQAELLAMYADNNTKNITAQYGRDLIVSGPIGTDQALDLAAVLAEGNDAGGADIEGVGALRLGGLTGLEITSFLNGVTNYDLLTALGGKLAYDPDYNNGVFVFGGLTFAPGTAATYDGDAIYDSPTVVLSNSYMRLASNATDMGENPLFAASTSENAINLQMRRLPTTDPNDVGLVYSVAAGDVAAEGAAGSRVLMISNGP